MIRSYLWHAEIYLVIVDCAKILEFISDVQGNSLHKSGVCKDITY